MNPDPKYQDKQRYVRVKLGRTSLIDTPENAKVFLAQLEQEDVAHMEVSEVWMTPHEFEQLPDFGGF